MATSTPALKDRSVGRRTEIVLRLKNAATTVREQGLGQGNEWFAAQQASIDADAGWASAEVALATMSSQCGLSGWRS